MILQILPYAINLLSGILLACATYTINKARKSHETEKEEAEKKEKALADGVQALLRESIVRNYNKYAPRHVCPVYAKENLESIYKAYAQLGGNHTAKQLYEELMKLPSEAPIKEEEHHD